MYSFSRQRSDLGAGRYIFYGKTRVSYRIINIILATSRVSLSLFLGDLPFSVTFKSECEILLLIIDSYMYDNPKDTNSLSHLNSQYFTISQSFVSYNFCAKDKKNKKWNFQRQINFCRPFLPRKSSLRETLSLTFADKCMFLHIR